MVTDARQKRIDNMQSNRQKDFVVVVEDVHDPHNAEAVFRTCDAFGIGKVCLVFEAQSPYNPKKVGKSTSSSANKWLDFEIFHSTKDCLAWLSQNEYISIATCLREDAVSIFDYKGPVDKIALWMGNEHRGLSDLAIKEADTALMIPMRGMVQSLNISVSAAICIYELSRLRAL